MFNGIKLKHTISPSQFLNNNFVSFKAWGVETITFVDNSRVSYSNPVRQSLFVFEDSIGSATNDNYKSVRAAENLKKIYPGVVFKLNNENLLY